MRTTIHRAAQLLTAGWFLLTTPAARAGEDIRFNRDIRPLLADTCFRCHGPAVKKAGLRLDQRDLALHATESGAVPIVPGNVEESEIIRRIFSDDESEVMPPPAARKVLSAGQKALVKRWVEEGASYEGHWAFVAPRKETVPTDPRPGPPRGNAIDGFIAARLRKEGLAMSPEADKATLIRRVSFALTGLPPTPQEVAVFAGDTSARAYENLVERLLFSPRFGEEMARHWLDVARYADTHGLHLDNERQIWLYRDWVVRAFNDNMPFDRFTIEQLAGDLLPDPTPDQLVATGFSRCGVTTNEGGSIEEEWYFRNAVDRASTMAEAWMGLTAGCAVCHDHKYDPLSQKEFYALYAFFYSAEGRAMDGNAMLHEPVLRMPTAEQKTRLADLDGQLAELEKEVGRQHEALAYRDPADPVVAAGSSGGGESETPEEPDKAKADDPAHSFRAWLKKGGKPQAKDAPPDIKKRLTAFQGGKGSPKDEETLRTYYVEKVCATTRGTFEPLLKQRDALTKDRTAVDAAVLGSYIFKEAATPRDAFVMIRGQYDKPGAKVEPATPAVLPVLQRAKPGGRANRLDLARWLVAPEHPLTARVAVNRIWQQLFGTGIVKTSYDFGTQGEPPSHPELLDWLAVSFRESGWDVKALVRLMVTSATFRQASAIAPEVLARDPENRLYAHGPRFRLDAEQIRDNALFVAGLINLEMGGKGVRPYQPPNIWEPVAFGGSNTRSYQQDSGPALYRRSLYNFLKRTAPPPFMANFDAPNREAFCTHRERSNTPLQALQLMNDVQHFEAARALASRMMTEGGSAVADRIALGFRIVLARAPEAEELAILIDQLGKHRARFVRDPEGARQAVHVGATAPNSALPEIELAAYALVANTLLNLDETVTRN